MVLRTLLRGRRLKADEVTASGAAKTAPAAPPVLSRQQLIGRIIQAAREVRIEVGREEAEATIRLWERAREEAAGPPRPRGRRIETLLTDDELRGPHRIMNRLMPDEQVAAPGSVHDELNRYVFGTDPATGRARCGVVHTMDSTDQCAVVVVVAPH